MMTWTHEENSPVWRIGKQLSFTGITVVLMMLGEDCHIAVYGGDTPHIGCTVLSVPRESLSGEGGISATSSVLNVSGHKDEAVCRLLAEQTAAALARVTVCTGGIHVEQITGEQIGEIMQAVGEIAGEIGKRVKEIGILQSGREKRTAL